jgi:hypothetical protein
VRVRKIIDLSGRIRLLGSLDKNLSRSMKRSFDLTHSLGPYPGTAFFRRLQSEKSYHVLGYEESRWFGKICVERRFPLSLRDFQSPGD